MKVLLTVHQFLPDYSAGTEILTLETAKELRRRGHEVHVFTGYPGSSDLHDAERFDRYTYDGIPVERFKHSSVPMGGQENVMEAEYNNRFVAAHFRAFLSKLRPDVVHCFHLSRLSASVIDLCCELRIPTVFTATDFWFVCPTNQLRLPDNSPCTGPDKGAINCIRHLVANTQPRGIRAVVNLLPKLVLSLLSVSIGKGLFGNLSFAPLVNPLRMRPEFLRTRLNKCDRVLAPTELMARILISNGLNRERVAVMPYGVNFQYVERSQRSREDQNGQEPFRIGFIGTLYEHKGPHVLVGAVRLIPDDPPVQVKLFGRTDEFPEYVQGLKRMASGDPRVQLCGSFPNHEIGRILSDLDVLVVPSLWYENSPVVIYEAQAAGCPVVASDVGGISEVIEDEQNGLLFPPGDVDGLARTLRRLLTDHGLLSRLAQNARRPRSIQEYVTDIVAVYEAVTSSSKESVTHTSDSMIP